MVRTAVAGLLRLPERRLRVVAPDVGGGFGQKCVVAREEALVLVAARAVGRPVKWVEDRQENLTPASTATSSATTSAPRSTPTGACSPSTPTSSATSAPTPATRSPAGSSR